MDENEVKQESITAYETSENMSLQCQRDLIKTCELLKSIKWRRRLIVDYWKAAKESAKQTYDEIAAKEKKLLKICDDTEKNLKNKILEYQDYQEKKVLEICKRAEGLRKFEAEVLLETATILKNQGRTEEAEETLKQAEKLKNMPSVISFPKSTNGVTIQKRWDCRVTNNKAVPVFFNGIEIREVVTKKLLEIRKDNPAVKIPGVEFYQNKNILVRSF